MITDAKMWQFDLKSTWWDLKDDPPSRCGEKFNWFTSCFYVFFRCHCFSLPISLRNKTAWLSRASFLWMLDFQTHTHSYRAVPQKKPTANFTDPLQGRTESCVLADTFLHNDLSWPPMTGGCRGSYWAERGRERAMGRKMEKGAREKESEWKKPIW